MFSLGLTCIVILIYASFFPPSPYLVDDFGHKKLAAQYIRRELWEADEANLIDEKGMEWMY